jgi:hypothetical protein
MSLSSSEGGTFDELKLIFITLDAGKLVHRSKQNRGVNFKLYRPNHLLPNFLSYVHTFVISPFRNYMDCFI